MKPRIGILCGLGNSDGGAHSSRDSVAHAYAEAVLAAGGAPLLAPCIGDAEAVNAVLEVTRGLIISGGPDVDPRHYSQQPRKELGQVSPERDELDAVAVEYALARPELPVLGICRGIQSLNVFAGGTLIQDIPSQVDNALKHVQQAPGRHGTHELEIVAGSKLADTLGADPLWVNSYHHEAIGEAAPGFCVVARAQDGVVEAIEREGARYCIGVQFHPEIMASTDARVAKLFERLVAEAMGERCGS